MRQVVNTFIKEFCKISYSINTGIIVMFQGVNKVFQVMWSICSNSPILNGKLPIPEISRFEIILA